MSIQVDIARLEEKLNAVKEGIERIEQMHISCLDERKNCYARFRNIENNAAIQKTKTGFMVTIISVIISAGTATIFRMIK